MYFTYIIRCKDDTLYTGYTSDIKRRVDEHKRGINCKYTRAKGFKNLEVYFVTNTKSKAMKLESYIKKLTKKNKNEIIEQPNNFIINLKMENNYRVGS